jgi:hypothetical protein
MSGAHNGQRKRFDLDAASAAALAESKPVPFAFSYKGQDYEVPAAVHWPLEAQALIAAGEIAQALTMLLGGEVYGQLVAAGMTVGELTVLFEAVGEAAGVGGLGNSLPSVQPASSPT